MRLPHFEKTMVRVETMLAAVRALTEGAGASVSVRRR